MRAAIYIRQSTYREESISVELQEHVCREYARERGYDVVMVEADPGISGRTFVRPAVQRVMQAVEDKAVDVVVLWKWSRLSRSRRDWAIAADKVEVAGGTIESATEPLDTATSTGRFARGMMVEMAAFESERIGDTWKESHARRVRQGLPANGKPRFGYLYTDKHFEPDPATGPILAEAYRRYIAGESVYALVGWLNTAGYSTVAGYGSSGGPWSDRSLRRVLDSGFGAGYISYRGELLPGKHEPVITEDEWKSFQAARQRRRITRSGERSQYMLSGLVRCSCGSSMTAGQFGWQKKPKFRCKAAHDQRRHDGGYITMTVVEKAVHDWLDDFAGGLTHAAETEAKIAAKRSRSKVDAGKLAQDIAACDTQLSRLTVQLVQEVVPESAYVSARDEITERKESLERRLVEVEDTARTLPASSADVEALIEAWDELSIAARREALRRLIRHVLVYPGRPHGKCVIVPVWGDE